MARGNVVRRLRKYKKAGLAALTLVAMVAFVFVPSMSPDVRSPAAKKVVATSKYGTITEYELDTLRQNRRAVYTILRELQRLVVTKGKTGQPLGGFLSSLRNSGLSNDGIADLWIASNRGRELGMVWSAEAYRQTLKHWTEGAVGDKAWQALLRRYHHSEKQFISLLGTEMISREIQNLGLQSPAEASLEQRFNWYKRTLQRAKIVAMAVPVDTFTAQISDPKDAELTRFFDRYKGEIPNPTSDQPGFKVPRQFDVEYIKLPIDAFMVAPESISEADARAYYDQNLGQFIDDGGNRSPVQPVEPTEAPATEAPASEAPETEAPATEAPETETPAAEAPVTETPAEVPVETSWDWARNPFQTASMQEAEPVAETAVEPAPAAEAPVAETPAVETPADATIAEPTTVRYIPFEEVKESIQQQLAAERSNEKRNEILEQIQDRLYEYSNSLMDYEQAKLDAEEAGEPTPPAPEPLNIDTVVEPFAQYGATSHRLDSFCLVDLSEGELDIAQDRGTFASHLFRGKVVLNEPYSTIDINENAYLFRVTADREEHEVTLQDEGVRETVLAAWKQMEARDLASQEATKLVQQVRDAAQPMRTVFADRELISPEPFAWMTPSRSYYGFGAPYLTTIPEIEDAGAGFMGVVFSMDVNGVATAWNQTKTVIYVVQTEEFSPDEQMLWALFPQAPLLGSQYYPGYYLNGQDDLISQVAAWSEAFRKECGFVWDAKPEDVDQELEESGFGM